MIKNSLTLPADYWQTLKISKSDVEFLHNYLFEEETPLTVKDLVAILVEERIQLERSAHARKKQAAGKVYRPKDRYKIGEALVFPALDWQSGKVTAVRPGQNVDLGEFDVLTVTLDGEDRQFAAGLENHRLNEEEQAHQEDDNLDPLLVISEFGALLEKKLDDALRAEGSLVWIAGRWFPRALLLDINAGQLNLVEAVLDVAGGEPLPTSALTKDIELPQGVNPILAEFSLNYALQEDARFDEVGPSGEVLWCLERLEPDEVRQPPERLRYTAIEHDRQALTPDMLVLEAELDDELSQVDALDSSGEPKDVVVSLTYPHWRSGTLPISARMHALFPSAYISPRVRFTLVDVKGGQKIPAWAVREFGYVYGLAEWYKKQELIPGSLIRIRRGNKPGEVLLEAQSRRATRDWVRTAIVGADGGLVFAMLKQVVAADFNERMVVAIPDPAALDKIWGQKGRQPLNALIAGLMRELSKLTPQGHVHAQELYSALNLVRRCPPAPMLAALVTNPGFIHVGDLYFRLDDSNLDKEV